MLLLFPNPAATNSHPFLDEHHSGHGSTLALFTGINKFKQAQLFKDGQPLVAAEAQIQADKISINSTIRACEKEGVLGPSLGLLLGHTSPSGA